MFSRFLKEEDDQFIEYELIITAVWIALVVTLQPVIYSDSLRALVGCTAKCLTAGSVFNLLMAHFYTN